MERKGLTKYKMSDIYWAEECCEHNPEQAEIVRKSNESKDELQFVLADDVDSLTDTLEAHIKELEKLNMHLQGTIANQRDEINSCLDALIDAKNFRIKELEANQPKWISVEDELPNRCEPVLIFNNDKDLGWARTEVGLILDNVDKWLNLHYNIYCEPTHWMTLPQPPETRYNND